VLNPSPDRRIVDLQAAFDQQFLDITIGKGISKIPARGTENDLWCKVPPLEDRRSVRVSHDLSSIAVLSWRFFATHPTRPNNGARVLTQNDAACMPRAGEPRPAPKHRSLVK
jgi:hypothetical protein